ncbi:MAG: von Willebrand factor type A domain protein [Alphaproteobacteria bacterium ADurb.Bin438]|nr:MAG: von Willebrand factor type A domain protein [Alphaproteobacteria bacterium ADurb.Bin438]
MIEILFPYAFILILVPALVQKLSKPFDTNKDGAINSPFFEEMKNIAKSSNFISISSFKQNHFLFALSFLAWFLLTLALLRPVYVGKAVPIEQEGRNLIIAIDVSGSMEMPDFSMDGKNSNRLIVARTLSKNFVKKRKGDRIGVVLFGTTAHLFIPLSFDIPVILEMLNEVDFGLVGEKTAIGDAIGVALKSFKDVDSKSSVIILISDGSSNAGSLNNDQAIKLAKDMNVKIYTVGIGADKMRVASIFGTKVIDPSLDMDEEALKKIAKETNGEYFRARNTEDFENIYLKIDAIEKIKNDALFIQPKKELFYYPLALAFLIFSLVLLMRLKK